jgi:hypothetical protein
MTEVKRELEDNKFGVTTKSLAELIDEGWKRQGFNLTHRKYISIADDFLYLLGSRRTVLIDGSGKYFTFYEFPTTKFPTSIIKDGGLKYQIHLIKNELGLYYKNNDSNPTDNI